MPITAVDYDPFAKQATPAPSGTVEPVDYDPFAPAVAAAEGPPTDGILSKVWEGAKEGAGNVVSAGKDMLAAGADQAREIWSPPLDQGHAAPGPLYSLGTLGKGAGEIGDVAMRAMQTGFQVPAAMLRSEAKTLSEKVAPAAGFPAGAAGEVMGAVPEGFIGEGGIPHVAEDARGLPKSEAAVPAIHAPIDPQDVHPGDIESPIPTHVIAAGRKIVREATENPPAVAPSLAIPPAPDAAALGLEAAPEQTGQPAAATTPYIGVPQEPPSAAAAPGTSGPTPAQMEDVKSLLSQDNTTAVPPQSAPQEVPAPTPAPAPAEPANTGRPPPAEPDYSDAKTRAQTYSKWLDELDGQRRTAAAQSPMANLLRTTEASILNKVGGVESRLTNAAVGRLAEVRGALDELLNPVGDSPDMARVRAAMVEQHQKMADAAAPPPVPERSPAAEPDRTQPQAVAAEQPPAATATQPEIAPAQVVPEPVSASPDITHDIAAENNIVAPAAKTIGDGTREAPIEVSHPDHLAAAREVVDTGTTPAQDEAGNYQSAHVKVHGLDITIQKPLGSVRTGIGADGKPWESPPLKADYGHIKGTLSGDGEPVDVFVGPSPASSRVYVIDQRNAETGVHDESKAMLGFSSQAEAVDAYRAAFSDGKADQRIGGVTDLNTIDFKRLLKKGTLDRPLAPSKDAANITTPAKVDDFRAAEPPAKPQIETAPPLREAPSAGEKAFTTARGSTYAVHDDGTTTRDKAARADIGHEGQSGPQPRSQATFYVTPEQADALSLIQTKGGAAMALKQRLPGQWGIQYTDGPGAGKYEKRTVIKPQTEPAMGLTPVEVFNGGRTVHFGNEITKVGAREAGGKEITVPPNDTSGLPPKTAPKEITPPPSVKPAVKAAVAKDATAEAPAAVAAEPKPRALALKPLEGTGEERSRAINDATYRSGEERPQKEAAEKLVAEDPEGALAIALRQKQPPPDLHPEFVYMAMESKATREGDTALAERLKQSRIAEESTTMGQRIGAWKNRDPLSAVSHMQAVETARAAVLEQKTGSAAKAVTAEAREITKQVQAAKKQARALTPREKWAQTIAAITCKA